MSEFTITYHGHSCFTVECGSWRVAFDPYSPGSVPGLSGLALEADEVLCSHTHGDHGYRAAVKIRPHAAENPFTVETIRCPHDDAGGTKRGMNTIHILTAGGEKIVHMGDVGCALPEADMAKLRGALALLIPVGGYYTIDAREADAMARAIGARVVIPMHYRTATSGFDVIAPLEDFLALRDDITRCGDEITLTGGERGTFVLEQRAMM